VSPPTRAVLAVALSAYLLAGCAGAALTSGLPSTPTAAPRSALVGGSTPAQTSPAGSTTPWPEDITRHPAGSEGNELGLLSYLPAGYGNDAVAWPLLIYLHGYDANGVGSEDDLRKLTVPGEGISSLVAAGDWPNDRPFIVLMPQYSYADAQHCELADEIRGVIDWAARRYRIDTGRVYLTGISCGAIGVLDYLASSHEQRVAAAVPIASAPIFAWQKAGCAIAGTPMWFFHGALDEIVPVHVVEDVVLDLRACTDPRPAEVKLTIYPDANHNEWPRTYDGSAGHDIYTWMLRHTKG
jgi:predicted peptidase